MDNNLDFELQEKLKEIYGLAIEVSNLAPDNAVLSDKMKKVFDNVDVLKNSLENTLDSYSLDEMDKEDYVIEFDIEDEITADVVLSSEDRNMFVNNLDTAKVNAIILALYERFKENGVGIAEFDEALKNALDSKVVDLEDTLKIDYKESIEKQPLFNVTEGFLIQDTPLDVLTYLDESIFSNCINSLVENGIFHVERLRSSVTQGEAAVYGTNNKIVQYGDEMWLRTKNGTLVNGLREVPDNLKPGNYGEILNGWGSIKTDEDLIKSAIRQYPKEVNKALKFVSAYYLVANNEEKIKLSLEKQISSAKDQKRVPKEHNNIVKEKER